MDPASNLNSCRFNNCVSCAAFYDYHCKTCMKRRSQKCTIVIIFMMSQHLHILSTIKHFDSKNSPNLHVLKQSHVLRANLQELNKVKSKHMGIYASLSDIDVFFWFLPENDCERFFLKVGFHSRLPNLLPDLHCHLRFLPTKEVF